MKKRQALGPQQKWSSKFGFIMAAVGSAVGLGNIWRFPYIATAHGGALFLLTYLVIVVILGFMVMSAELTIGRYSGRSVMDAFRRGNKNWSFIGIISITICFLIVSYYSVIGGWISKYMFSYLGGGKIFEGVDYGDVFGGFINDGMQSAGFNFLFLFCSILVLVFGVKKGIEKVSKVLMPALFVMLIVVAIVSLTMPGALSGLEFFFVPKDMDIVNANGGFLGIVNAAMGQAFFSLSVGIGINCTYGSYLAKDSNIPKDSATICGFDTLVAIIAGVAIIPAVFAMFGGEAMKEMLMDPEKAGAISGPGLIFLSLPKVFATIGAGTAPWFGNLMGFIFFLLVWVAALTSCISLLEVLISSIEQKFHINRLWSTIIVGVGITITSTLVSYSVNPDWGVGISLLDLFDLTTVNYLMPLAAICMCLFITFIWKGKNASIEVTNNNVDKHPVLVKIWQVFVMYICPVLIAIVFIMGLVQAKFSPDNKPADRILAFSALGLGIFSIVLALILGYIYNRKVHDTPLAPLGAHFDANADSVTYAVHELTDGNVEGKPQEAVQDTTIDKEVDTQYAEDDTPAEDNTEDIQDETVTEETSDKENK